MSDLANHLTILIVFPGDVEFKKVSQSKDRVFLLKFNSSEARLFFWSQEANVEDDEAAVKKMNIVINGGQLSSTSNTGVTATPSTSIPITSSATPKKNTQSTSSSLPVSQTPATPSPVQRSNINISSPNPIMNNINTNSPNPNPNPNPNSNTNPASAFTPDQIAQLRELMMGQRQPQQQDIELSDVLTPESLNPLLANKNVCEALFPHLPDGAPRTTDDIREVIRSSAFQQVCNALP